MADLPTKQKIVTCTDRNGNKYAVPADELTFRPSVYAIIIENDHILLSKPWDGYDFPGGGIEIGETIQEALIHEVKEETGLAVSVGKLVNCEDSFYKLHSTGSYIHSLLLYYLCSITGGEISKEFFDENERTYMDKPEWINLKEIQKVKFYNSVDSLAILEEAKRIKA